METKVVHPLTVDPALLTPIVRKASGRDDLSLEDWQVLPISGGLEFGTAIFRLTGGGISAGEAISWSIILKVIPRRPDNNSNQQASHYWLREPLYYQSGIFDALPASIRSPRCYAALEQPDGFWLFLEDISDRYDSSQPGHGWPFEYYRTAARCLGQFNGAYLVGEPIPEASWIPTQWLRSYIEDGASNVNLCFASLEHPFFQRTFPHEFIPLLYKAWAERKSIFSALESLPQVFCHQDAFCRNLYAQLKPDGSNQLVAIDWSFAGRAALGSELSVLVNASMVFGPIPYAQSEELYRIALDGYLMGLQDTGWRGNVDQVRFTFAATVFWRYVFGAIIGEGTHLFLDEKFHPMLLQGIGVDSIDQLADLFASSIPWYTNLYEETLRLRNVLKL